MSRGYWRSVGVVLAGLAAGTTWAAEQAKPNIIFIMADDLGWGDLGCYGQQKVPTPSLDRLAAQGLRCTDFCSGSTVCAPSRSCLMSGRHTGHTAIRGNGPVPLPAEEKTIAEVLKTAGYTTAIFGKWGLGDEGTASTPEQRGFDHWFGYLNQTLAHNYYPEFLFRNGKKVTIEGNTGGKKTAYSHDLFTEEALAFLEKAGDKPFFLYLAYTIPHANNELKGETGDGMEVPDYGSYREKPWTNPQKGHAAMIERMDRDIGRIAQLLARKGLERNTMVMFTSDNGPQQEGGFEIDFFDCNGPYRGIKRDLYDGGIRVPMIVRWPAVVAAGTTSAQPWANYDVLPTLAEAAGVPSPAGIDGLSMMGVLKGGKPARDHEYLYWEFHERGFSQAVRTGQFKGVRRKDNPLEIYDLASDAGESRDIAAQKPELVQRIEGWLATSRTPSERWPGTSRPAPRKKGTASQPGG